MEDDDAPPRREPRLSPARMSKTPSWLMLGFALGALFVAALPPLRKKPAPAPDLTRRIEFTRPPAARLPQPPTTIEAVFAEWGEYAVWADDTTEVALWNGEYREFTDFFEVRRFGKTVYFRSIVQLTRRLYTPPKLPPECPLRFTEPEEHYRERRERGEVTPATELSRPRGFGAPASPPPMSTAPVTAAAPAADLTPEVRK